MPRLLVLAPLVLLLTFVPGTGAQARCELPPLTLPLFNGTPVADLATPVASPVVTTLSEDEATALLEMYVACTNTGDPALVWAMFTPHWFSTRFADPREHYLPALEREIAAGTMPVGDPLQLEQVDKIERMNDGRYAVTATFASGELRWTDQLILANVNGQWLIDDVVLITPGG